MAATKKRIVGQAAPNRNPRPPSPEQALNDLSLMTTAGLRSSIELRALGMADLADMLCARIDDLRAIQRAVTVRLNRAARTPGDPETEACHVR